MRKTFDGKFKSVVALEALREDKALAEIAVKYQVHPNQISNWKKEALEKLPELFQDGRRKRKSDEPVITRDDLLREIGQLKVENEFLKKKHRQLFGEVVI